MHENLVEKYKKTMWVEKILPKEIFHILVEFMENVRSKIQLDMTKTKT